jgi:hypothetical protein
MHWKNQRNILIDKTLNFFDYYTDLGWEIIPIKPNSKRPFFPGWNNEYDPISSRKYIENNVCNLGLLLGKIVDIEADTSHANNLLNNLVKDYPHPMYQSEKSIHHLFRSPDSKLTRIVLNGIEFRGNKHQSVLPPSTNSNGIEYTWIDYPTNILPPLPEKLFNFYKKHTCCNKLKTVEPWCDCCGGQSRPIHYKRYKIELKAFESIGKKWSCHKCRDEIRGICRKIRSSVLSI